MAVIGGISKLPNLPLPPSGGQKHQALVMGANNASTWRNLYNDHPGYVAGRFYCQHYMPWVEDNATLYGNTFLAVPFYINEERTITSAAIRINTASTAGNCLMGIYQNAVGKPTTRITEFGSVSTATTGDKIITSLSQVVQPGWVHFVLQTDETCQCTGVSSFGTGFFMNLIGRSNLGQHDVAGLGVSRTYAPLPTNAPAVDGYTGEMPAVYLVFG